MGVGGGHQREAHSFEYAPVAVETKKEAWREGCICRYSHYFRLMMYMMNRGWFLRDTVESCTT